MQIGKGLINEKHAMNHKPAFCEKNKLHQEQQTMLQIMEHVRYFYVMDDRMLR